jgi:hypothetical protein
MEMNGPRESLSVDVTWDEHIVHLSRKKASSILKTSSMLKKQALHTPLSFCSIDIAVVFLKPNLLSRNSFNLMAFNWPSPEPA